VHTPTADFQLGPQKQAVCFKSLAGIFLVSHIVLLKVLWLNCRECLYAGNYNSGNQKTNVAIMALGMVRHAEFVIRNEA
jgi:hypothetical protein